MFIPNEAVSFIILRSVTNNRPLVGSRVRPHSLSRCSVPEKRFSGCCAAATESSDLEDGHRLHHPEMEQKSREKLLQVLLLVVSSLPINITGSLQEYVALVDRQ
jgi:hypothetical protein